MRKHINSETVQFEDVMTDNLVLDAQAQLGSFNAITSDAVARAVAGASGELPEVTSEDNGKVLIATYDEMGPGVEWAEEGGSDIPDVTENDDGKVLKATYSGGEGSFGWEAETDPLPSYSDSDAGKVLSVNSQGTGVEWVEETTPTVDQTYDATSANAQSGTAVSEAVGGVLPSITGNSNKVLAVNSGATGVEWVTAGGNDTKIAPYTLRFKFLDTAFDPSSSVTGTDGTWTRVSSDPNVWDWTYENADWNSKFKNKSFSASGSAIIGSGDLSGVTAMYNMFQSVNNLNYIKIGNFGTTVIFSGMFQYAGYDLEYVELGEPGDICYGSMGSMFMGVQNYSHGNKITVVFNGMLAATNMQDFAHYNKGLVEAPMIYTNLPQHPCTMFGSAFDGCENLVKVPNYKFGTTQVNFENAFNGCKSLVHAPDINLSYASYVTYMFRGCESLVHVPDYDITRASSVSGMFSGCRSLVRIPTLTGIGNKSSVAQLFENCYGVQTGADTLYQQLSTQAFPPTYTTDTFKNCGAATVTGAAALATIPAAWGGGAA